MTTLKVLVKQEYDDDFQIDDDWLGKFSSKWEPGAITVRFRDLPYAVTEHFSTFRYREDYRTLYYIPSEGLDGIAEYYSNKMGYSRQQAWLEEQRSTREAMQRLIDFYTGQWRYIGFVVIVTCEEVKVGYASCWGIESDSDDYIHEIEQELIDEALEDAYATLKKLSAADNFEIEVEKKYAY